MDKSIEKQTLKADDRDFGADVVRIAAGIMVLTLHFFLRNGFYYREMTGFFGISALTVRFITLSCVPLFVMLSGYLKVRKEWSWAYYKSLLPIIVSYVLISLMHLPYKILVVKERHSVSEWIMEFLNFDLAEYGWYVGMYIGLFLLSPFLNRMWNACRNRKEHTVLTLTLISVTFLTSTVNTLTASDANLLPAYFTGMYYITYYILGCFIRTYRPKVRQGYLWTLILITGLANAVMNICTRTDPADFYTGYSAGYSHLFTALITVCMFLSLYRLESGSMRVRKTAARLSGGIFEMYLCSYLFDRVIYRMFYKKYPLSLYLPVGILMVGAVFAGAFLLGTGVKFLSGKICGRLLRKQKDR